MSQHSLDGPQHQDRTSRRVVVIGAVPPIRSGIAQHTSKLIEGLRVAGHDVTVLSWASQYPKRLYRSTQVDQDTFPPANTRFMLRWWAPWTWVAAGLAARRYDIVVIPWVHPVQAIALRIVTLFAGRTPTVAIVHNVVPHERFVGDRLATRLFLGGVDAAVTQSHWLAGELRQVAPSLQVRVAPHPPNFTVQPASLPQVDPLRLLFLGYVRPYKGLDLLLRALVQLRDEYPSLRVTVAGEMWEPDEVAWREQLIELDIADRVDIRPGYVPDDEVSEVLGRHHMVVAPYRSATQSGIVPLAHAAGRPIIVTPVGGLPEQVRDGIDGIVASRVDAEALADAIRRGLAACETLSDGALASGPTWETFATTTLDAVLMPAED